MKAKDREAQEQASDGAKKTISESTALALAGERAVEFIPFGSNDAIQLSANMVRQFVAVPTKSGQLPSARDCVKFVMLCQAKRLNPFEGDAYLVGYDGHNGPQFSLLTAHQAFLKRAEASPEYDGMESGVIIIPEAGGDFVEREGDLILEGERLIGGWARVHFKTRTVPMFKRVRFEVYNTGYSRWKADPGGMIVKVSESDALRSSFPTLLGGMYIEQELQKVQREESGAGEEDTMLAQTKRTAEKLMRTAQEAGTVADAVDGEIVPDDEKSPAASTEAQPGASEPVTETPAQTTKTGGKVTTGKKPNGKGKATTTKASPSKSTPPPEQVAEPVQETVAETSAEPVTDDYPAFVGEAQAQTLGEQMKEKDGRMAKSIAASLKDFDLEKEVYKRYAGVYLDELNTAAGADLIAWLKHLAKGSAA